MCEDDLMATGQRRALAATLLVVAVTLGHHRGLDTEPEPSEHPIREWSSEEPSQVYCQDGQDQVYFRLQLVNCQIIKH